MVASAGSVGMVMLPCCWCERAGVGMEVAQRRALPCCGVVRVRSQEAGASAGNRGEEIGGGFGGLPPGKASTEEE